MRRSRFDVLIRDFPDPGEHVLYSTLHDRYVGLDDAAVGLLERTERNEPLEPQETEVLSVLREHGFVVENRAEDDKALHARFASETGSTEVLDVTVMPTAACNLACNYCYQNAQPTGDHQSGEVEDETFAWIVDWLDRLGSRKLALTFFGGEPLLRKDYLKRMARRLAQACGQRGVIFEFGMITNGTLLDEITLLTLKELGLAWTKITLDGDRGTHDLVRIRRGGQGTFDSCMKAVRLLLKHDVKLLLGGNYQAGQVDGFIRLLDYLEAQGLKDRLGMLNLKPALETSADSCGAASWSGADQGELGRMLMELERRGFPAPNPTQLGPCHIHYASAFTVDEHGYVYKCGGTVGRESTSIAHVRDVRTERRSPLTATKPWRICGDCPYVPSCYGGCLAALHMKTGAIGEVNCERLYFQETALEVVKQRYLAEFHPAEARPIAA